MRSQPYLKSAATIFRPLWNLTSGRMVNVSVLPSLLMTGGLAARFGTGPPN